VTDNRTGGISYWQAGDHQSVADRNGVSLAEYIHALFGLLLQRKPRHVLMIGGAGGTLATMLTRRGIRVTLVDINPTAFDIARLYFQMPAEVDCHISDGVAFVRRNRSRFDAIVLDAFSEEKIPPHFRKSAFFRLVKKRLKPGGIFLINLTVLDDEDPMPDGICHALKSVWRKVRLLDSDGYVDRNAIAMAGAVDGLKRPTLRMKPATSARTLRKELSQLAFRALRDV
jgi:spermidine synthase